MIAAPAVVELGALAQWRRAGQGKVKVDSDKTQSFIGFAMPSDRNLMRHLPPSLPLGTLYSERPKICPLLLVPNTSNPPLAVRVTVIAEGACDSEPPNSTHADQLSLLADNCQRWNTLPASSTPNTSISP